MKWFKRLRKEEDGNVLYMTVVMIMVLIIFTLVLVNTIQIAAMKIRAQQAADHMVLSVATLKARYLNQKEVSMVNSVITAYLKLRGTKKMPFVTHIEYAGALAVIAGMDAIMMGLNIKYNYDITHSDVLDKIKAANGLDDDFTKIVMGPIDIIPGKDMMVGFTDVYIESPYPPFYHPAVMPTVYEPTNNLAVQARVEWNLDDKIIGHRLLNVSMPDMVTRARAEVYDASVLQGPLGRYWKVRLMPPSDKVDNELKNR